MEQSGTDFRVVGNFYAPIRTLLEGAVAAGFILEKNLALVKVIDLDGGKAANFEEARADEWGPAVIKALKEWEPLVSLLAIRDLLSKTYRLEWVGLQFEVG